jgi:hypothetical protein
VQLNHYKNYHPYRLTPRQRKFLVRWQKRRKVPVWKYILFHGILQEAFAGMLVIKLLQYIFDRKGFVDFYFNGAGIVIFILEILFWLTGGAAIGWFKRRTYETEYEMLKSMEHF